MTTAPPMQRSRTQLASAYAPNSLFTFEGGAGACMAISFSGNRAADDDLRTVTRRLIGEQIQEYFDAWMSRATRGVGLLHPVPNSLAVDNRVLRDDVVDVALGDLAFQVPDRVGYVPFPLAFVCGRCGLHRECDRVESLVSEAERFRDSCPGGRDQCADDWQQLDVVMAHWSGEVEPISPRYRYWSTTGEIHTIRRCASCDSERFYLRRPPGPFSGWHFECVACRTPRQLLQRDRWTLGILGPLTTQSEPQDRAVFAEINMEPISYRASAVHYTHGDRLLVFNEDRYLQLLAGAREAGLATFLAGNFGYPATTFTDQEKESLLRDAGRGNEWSNYAQLRLVAQMLLGNPATPRAMIDAQLATIARMDADWNATVFAQHRQAEPGIVNACAARHEFVRRFDPIRMAVEHRTLAEEKLHGGQLADGKQISVDVTVLDEFLFPDEVTEEAEREQIRSASRRRLDLLGIAEMRLVRDVQVCEYTFGYTRTSATPTVRRDKAGQGEMPVRLRLFDRVMVGEAPRHPVLCLMQSNEGFYVRLEEANVLRWLSVNEIPLGPAPNGVRLGGRLIEEFALIQDNDDVRFSRFLDEYRRERSVIRHAYPFVYTLLHTMAHHLIEVSASMSGLDLGSFGEHIFTPDLAFLVYRRGMTMDLGNLSSMWRERGDRNFGNEVLNKMVDPTSLRCGSESICNHRGGACPDCILIPENACLTRNELLSRSVLIGRGKPRWDAGTNAIRGYYEVSSDTLGGNPSG